MTIGLRACVLTAFSLLFWGNAAFLFPDVLYAFHEGGPGYCEGCHDLCSPVEGEAQETAAGGIAVVGANMLKGSDPSSTCLNCHAEVAKFYNILSTNGSRYTPGGDFYWLKKTFSFVIDGTVFISDGDSHGHNVVASDYGLMEDRSLSSAPGGTYPSFAMQCISCHNPHDINSGNTHDSREMPASGSSGWGGAQDTTAGNYRLLGGAGYTGGNLSAVSFSYPAPVAVANHSDWTETDSSHPAYGSGMSEWCANCHGDLLSSGNKHPAGIYARLSSSVITNYNRYLKSGDARGMQATAYLSLVPFELGTPDISGLNPFSTAGPDPSGKANVMCLTCHRAHASAFPVIGRWDFRATFIADSHPKTGDGGVTGSDVLHSYYGRNMTVQFGQYQRSLCNKCHIQD